MSVGDCALTKIKGARCQPLIAGRGKPDSESCPTPLLVLPAKEQNITRTDNYYTLSNILRGGLQVRNEV